MFVISVKLIKKSRLSHICLNYLHYITNITLKSWKFYLKTDELSNNLRNFFRIFVIALILKKMFVVSMNFH